MDELEIIVANLTGQVRRVTWRGREYLVAPVTMIVPGVLNGSQGPGLYTDEENSKDPSAWDHMPIVLRHPVVNGKPSTARKPEILDKYQIGYVFESKADPKLAAEAWFDVEWTRNADATLADDKKVLPRLEANKPVAVSTGLGLTKEKATGVFNGVQYSWIARNYKPDHLAVLPDEPGACDIKDGCGVLVNEDQPVSLLNKIKALLGLTSATPAAPATNPPTASNAQGDTTVKLTPQQRTGYVDILVANCACTKPETRKAFESLPDTALKVMAENKKGGKKPVLNAEEEVADGVSISELAGFLGVVADPATDPVAYMKELKEAVAAIMKKLEAEPAAEPAADAPAGDQAAPAVNRKKTKAQWLADAPAEVQDLLNSAQQVQDERKQELINKLTANVAADKKAAKARALNAYSLKQLKDMVDLLPPAPTRQATNSDGDMRQGNASFWGAQGAPVEDTTNSGEGDDEEDILLPAVANARSLKQGKNGKKTS